MNVAVLGASTDPEKYSHRAVMLLKGKGHRVFPVHHSARQIEGLEVFASIRDIPEPLDTVSVYVPKEVSSTLWADILSKRPRRIILNPGAENPELEKAAVATGIQVLNACTLVLLKTRQF